MGEILGNSSQKGCLKVDQKILVRHFDSTLLRHGHSSDKIVVEEER
jgi:hypothetical protein